MKQGITIKEERLSAVEYIGFLKRSDLVLQISVIGFILQIWA
jgi:hypothetical protein